MTADTRKIKTAADLVVDDTAQLCSDKDLGGGVRPAGFVTAEYFGELLPLASSSPQTYLSACRVTATVIDFPVVGVNVVT